MVVEARVVAGGLMFRGGVPLGSCAWRHLGRRRSMIAGVKILPGIGRANGGGTRGHCHLPEVSVVVAPFPSSCSG